MLEQTVKCDVCRDNVHHHGVIAREFVSFEFDREPPGEVKLRTGHHFKVHRHICRPCLKALSELYAEQWPNG